MATFTILQYLNDSTATSSVGTIVGVSIFLSLVVFSIVLFVLGVLRAPKPPEDTATNATLFTQIDLLRSEIGQLRNENGFIRELHAKAVAHVTRLKDEIEMVKKTSGGNPETIAQLTAETERLKSLLLICREQIAQHVKKVSGE